MTLYQFHRNAVLFPLFAVILVTLIYSIIDNYNYESEWLTSESVIFMSIITALIYSIILSGLSLTIFLNKLDKCRTNNTLNAMTWFLLPFGLYFVFLNI